MNKKNFIKVSTLFLLFAVSYKLLNKAGYIPPLEYFLSSASDRSIKSYPVVFGSNPVGDKLQEGDRQTPEGTFNNRS